MAWPLHVIGSKYGILIWALSCFLLVSAGFEGWALILRLYAVGIEGFRIRGPYEGPMALILDMSYGRCLLEGLQVSGLHGCVGDLVSRHILCVMGLCKGAVGDIEWPS